MSENNILDDIEDILGGKPPSPMPESKLMVDKALEILSQSPQSYPLVDMTEKESINIHVINTAREVSYNPQQNEVYIGITSFDPTQPTRFVLLLADALLEIKLEMEGLKQPPPNDTKENYIAKTAEKKATKVAELCSIAFDLDQKEQFKGYRFIDEMHKMGHNKAMDVFVSNL